jgi:hypothetical protein
MTFALENARPLEDDCATWEEEDYGSWRRKEI